MPAANFIGSSAFTYTVTSGGTEETASVRVDVQAPAAAPRELPVLYTGLYSALGVDEVRPPSTQRPAEGLRPGVDRVVVTTVNAINSLSGTAQLLAADGVVCQAVNGLCSLHGQGELAVHGVVGETVNQLRSLQGIDARGARAGWPACLTRTNSGP